MKVLKNISTSINFGMYNYKKLDKCDCCGGHVIAKVKCRSQRLVILIT
jgi:hypothetical protein